MSGANLAELVDSFASITGVSKAVATALLRKHKLNLEVALNEFYTNPETILQPERKRVSSDDIAALFERYADGDEIDAEGIENLCNDLKIDIMDPVMLMFAWQLDAKVNCVFSREEWMKGMNVLGVDSIPTLKARLEQLRTSTSVNNIAYKPFYNFCFLYSREPGQKNVQLAMALAVWELILKPRWPLYPRFAEYLQVQNENQKIKVINKDTWHLLYEFTCCCSDNFEAYKEDDAWPIVIDDFVAYVKSSSSEDNL